MKNDIMSWLLGMTMPMWAPAEEGAGGGGGTDGDGEGSGTSGDEGETQTTETVLGGDQTDDKSVTGEGESDDAKKDDKSDGKDDKSDADGKDEDKKDDGADEVPEDGNYAFELPEGVELDDEKKEFWSGQFKEIGLTRAQAQKLIELQSEQVVTEQKAFAEFLENQQKTHLDAAKKDKDIGGDKWAESARLANLGLKTFGGDAIKNLILTSGNGNNPEMIRELRRIGEMVKSDKFEPGASHEAPVSAEKKWYGETTPDTKKG